MASLTDREVEILSKAWKCMKTTPEVDYGKLAKECGMTNVGSASNAWGKIRKKLFPDTGASSAGGDGTSTAPATPKRTPKRKAAVSTPAADPDGGNAVDPPKANFTPINTPTKKRQRKTPAKSPSKTKVKTKGETTDDNETEVDEEVISDTVKDEDAV